ncbi:MAG: T9SS type A sorting domain-containing protein [Balneolales bacterium]|nr:T9SS type A sorting domain-containing protein [Balneolales bacterium]
MTTLKQTSLLLAMIVAFVSIHNSNVYAQYYDLSVGVERHFIFCAGFTGACPAGVRTNTAIEKVEDLIRINGIDYAVVSFTTYLYDAESNELTPITTDTSYYRTQGSRLYAYADGTDTPVFDFGFALGDSISEVLDPFIVDADIQSYGVLQQGIASFILVDTLIQFTDGIVRNVQWGEDTLFVSNGNIYPPPLDLEFEFQRHNNIPTPINYGFNNPFYHIKGIGVIFTPFNHRESMMCGFKTADGVHLGCNAGVRITSIASEDVPSNIPLLMNYPNPFNPTTQIRFSLPMETAVELDVYTITGRHVANLVSEVRPAGTHQVTFDAADLASGVYMYRIRAGNFIETHKLTLIR